MSKSLGNYIGLAEPPEQIYGKTMSIPDRLTEKYVRLISGMDAKEQAEVLAMKPRDAKAPWRASSSSGCMGQSRWLARGGLTLKFASTRSQTISPSDACPIRPTWLESS